MRLSWKMLGLGFIVAGVLRAETAPAVTEEAIALKSKISEVTVYADRARVTRLSSASLRAGVVRFAFPKLPGWLDEGSVRVSLNPAAAGEVLDVQVDKTFLARPEDA